MYMKVIFTSSLWNYRTSPSWDLFTCPCLSWHIIGVHEILLYLKKTNLGYVYPLVLQKIHDLSKMVSKIYVIYIFLARGAIVFHQVLPQYYLTCIFWSPLSWTRKISSCAKKECSKCKRKNLDTVKSLLFPLWEDSFLLGIFEKSVFCMSDGSFFSCFPSELMNCSLPLTSGQSL